MTRISSCTLRRGLATLAPRCGAGRNHKIVVIGGGSAGIALSHQLLRQGSFGQHDIAIIDPATWHHYQPGWTLVGGGLKNKEDLRKPLSSLMDRKFKFYDRSAVAVHPEQNQVIIDGNESIYYEQLVVAPGIIVDHGSIKGLTEALQNPDSLVSCIYDYAYCDKAYRSIQKLHKGKAIFTQPTGIVKCAGAPQKIMWLALDYWKRAGYRDLSNQPAIDITFATGLPFMFGVPKYNAKLNELRLERRVDGLFEHDLVSIEGNTATFACTGKESVKMQFDFLHATPKNKPHAFVKQSGLANEAGYVDVDPGTTRHKKYSNVWSIGDASGLPTSKTMAAITAQAPVLVSNLLSVVEGKDLQSVYDGYTSCPLTTGDRKVLLAEFKYGGEPSETFNKLFGIDQGLPRRAFYHLKKDFFPWVYSRYHVNGTWAGPKGFVK